MLVYNGINTVIRNTIILALLGKWWEEKRVVYWVIADEFFAVDWWQLSGETKI